MVRPASIDSHGMKKGEWSEDEDCKLRAYITKYGHWNWRLLPKYAGLARCGKSCRLRWMNYLKPDIKRGNFTREEDELLSKLHQQLGNKWSAIAEKLPGRTDNEVKNYWHTKIKKRCTNIKPNPHSKQSIESANPSKTTSFETNQINSSPSLMVNSPKEFDQNSANSYTTKSLNSITNEFPILDTFWDNISSSPFPIDSDNYDFQKDCSPENEFLNCPQFQCTEHFSSSNQFGDDDHIISSDSASIWSEILSFADDPYVSLDHIFCHKAV